MDRIHSAGKQRRLQTKLALAAITGALAILATPASVQKHGDSQG